MRVLFWYCKTFAWDPAVKTMTTAGESESGKAFNTLVAMVHVEPVDREPDHGAGAALTKNAKWLAKKWGTKSVVLHAFPHLGEEKAAPDAARLILDRVQAQLEKSGHTVKQTPHGYFLDLGLQTPGNPLASVYKTF